jgi:hypothetical protein
LEPFLRSEFSFNLRRANEEAFHNWIPLGILNNLKGIRAEFATQKLLITAFVNLTPVAIGLAAGAFYFGRAYPGWLFWWLWITYGFACYGSLMAWWIPYPFCPQPKRAAPYQVMYPATHSSFPEHKWASGRIRYI